MNITQIDKQIEKLNKQKQEILDKQKSETSSDWLSISKTKEINIKQQFNNQTYSEILKQLKPNERIQKELSQSKLKVMGVKQEAMQSEARHSSQA